MDATAPAHEVRVRPAAGAWGRLFVSASTAIVILAVALLALMSPLWMHLALSATAAPYFATTQLAFDISDRTVAELFLGPGTFATFGADEAAHMRDVRLVLLAFLALAAASAVFLGWSIARGRRSTWLWRAVGRGGAAVVVAVVVIGAVGAVAFDIAFELFHRILFSGGNWSFPADSLLIRLYPYAFWQLSAGALGVLMIGGGAAVWYLARRRARSLAGVDAS